MKNKWKKLSSLLLSLALVLSLTVPTNVYAEDTVTEVTTETTTEVTTEENDEATDAPDAVMNSEKNGGVRIEGYEFIEDELSQAADFSDMAEDFAVTNRENSVMANAANNILYDSLTASEKAWWDAMDATCYAYLNSSANVSTTLNVKTSDGSMTTVYTLPYTDIGSSSNAEREKMTSLFRYSNPQYYFLSSMYVYNGSRLTMVVYDIFADGAQRQNYTNLLLGKINWYLAQVDNSKMPEEREKQIHDLVCNTITYEFGDYDQSVFSSLYFDETVCAGYTMIMTLLLNMNGIPAIGVAGYGDDYANPNARHAWNLVKLYDHWYYVDATWDDGDPGVYYKYYNISKSTLYNDHYLQTYYSSIVPTAAYNSGNYTYSYSAPYISLDNIKYFIVNKGSGTKYVRVVDLLNNTLQTAVPETITYGGYTYRVLGREIPGFAERMYTTALNRGADAQGLRYFTYTLANRMQTGASAASVFLCGAELYGSGISQQEYVSRVYRTLLDREADEAGINYWVNFLNNGVSREYVLKGFCNSSEFAALCSNAGIVQGDLWLPEARDLNPNVTMYVFRCYARTLGRAPDVDGLNYWAGLINAKTIAPAAVAECFVFSEEFMAKNYNDTQYIQVLYSMFFDREADAAGLNYWLGELSSGARDRKAVFYGFVYTPEFNAILASFGL